MNGPCVARWLALPLIALTACDGLRERPGHDFSLEVLSESPSTVTGQIYAPVRFRVAGCSAFELSVQGPSGAIEPVSYSARGDGTFEAALPVAWMRKPLACPDLQWPNRAPTRQGTLRATCTGEERAATANLSLEVNTAWLETITFTGGIRAILDGERPFHPGMLSAYFGGFGTVWFPQEVTQWRALNGEWSASPDWWPGSVDPLIRPRWLRNGSRAFVTLGCGNTASCPEIPVTSGWPEDVATERVAEVAYPGEEDDPPIGVAYVPTPVVDMAYDRDGSLVVLSRTWLRTIVTRVTPAPEGSAGVIEDTVAVIADLFNEAAGTRLSRTASGQLAFASFAFGERGGTATLNLHVIDGSTVTTRYSAGGFEQIEYVSDVKAKGRVDLSPDASTLIVSRGEGSTAATYWMNTDPADQVWQPLPDGVIYHGTPDAGAAWLPDAVALWTGVNAWALAQRESVTEQSVVQVYEAAPPHVLRWEYRVEALPGATEVPLLLDVRAVGDRLVLSTSTGLRVLDRDGRVVAGSDPFPCGAKTTATAEQTGPTTVGVGAGQFLYVFDVNGNTPANTVPDSVPASVRLAPLAATRPRRAGAGGRGGRCARSSSSRRSWPPRRPRRRRRGAGAGRGPDRRSSSRW